MVNFASEIYNLIGRYSAC